MAHTACPLERLNHYFHSISQTFLRNQAWRDLYSCFSYDDYQWFTTRLTSSPAKVTYLTDSDKDEMRASVTIPLIVGYITIAMVDRSSCNAALKYLSDASGCNLKGRKECLSILLHIYADVYLATQKKANDAWGSNGRLLAF